PGVFVGHLSGMVRDKLWEKCCQKLREGGAVQLWSTNNEQRFDIRTFGQTRRQVVDFDGLKLIMLPITET
ncbi:MAG: type I-E CRISPR-associated endoribonuclease Cas2, partial [Caldilineaceae bacterium]|nr:type I-E CRISPR-associated endoribonuclease Cas2 [Caldilineaceae bacterium]